MRVYSYVVASDSGFAPNPFHGICTLACCKPKVRETASAGDIVVGLSRGGENVVYAMKVDEAITFDEYWARPEFAVKRAGAASATLEDRRGDNIYEPTTRGRFRQLPSVHSMDDGTPDAASMRRDVVPNRVLVAREFAYFGAVAPPLPTEVRFLRVGRGHRCRFTKVQVDTVAKWFKSLRKGQNGDPHSWPPAPAKWHGRLAQGERRDDGCGA